MEFLREIGAGTIQLNIVLQVIIAMTLGAVIGYDREAADKPAGFIVLRFIGKVKASMPHDHGE